MKWLRIAAGSLTASSICWMSACSTFEESGLPGSASSMAQNQMMLVRKEPASFGYYRLTCLQKIHPDLAMFTRQKGTPDFLAETSNHDRDYFILYYLQRRHAYACRTRPGQRKTLEFAGPYPITQKEYRTLDGVRHGKKP